MIRIQNIYYMLAYAFQTLNHQGMKSVETESFENTAELFAEILISGLKMQIKRGLGQEYVLKTEALSFVRGKIDVSESVKTNSIVKKQLICTYDEFSVNSRLNQIIKSTIMLLLKKVSAERRRELRKLLCYMNEVDVIDLHSVQWSIRFNRNNQSYRMMIAVCYLTVKGLLQTQGDGTTKLMDFLDEQRMCRLYEKFILEYYRREFPQLSVSSSQIKWQLDDGFDEMLPVMQSDIMMRYKEKVLIIDAKYYSRATQVQYDKHTLHSNNLYQIFTYVKNKEAELSKKDEPHEVAGMLLYAKTDEAIQPDNEYQMSGNRIAVRALDMTCDFTRIKAQLDGIAGQYLLLSEDS